MNYQCFVIILSLIFHTIRFQISLSICFCILMWNKFSLFWFICILFFSFFPSVLILFFNNDYAASLPKDNYPPCRPYFASVMVMVIFYRQNLCDSRKLLVFSVIYCPFSLGSEFPSHGLVTERWCNHIPASSLKTISGPKSSMEYFYTSISL